MVEVVPAFAAPPPFHNPNIEKLQPWLTYGKGPKSWLCILCDPKRFWHKFTNVTFSYINKLEQLILVECQSISLLVGKSLAILPCFSFNFLKHAIVKRKYSGRRLWVSVGKFHFGTPTKWCNKGLYVFISYVYMSVSVRSWSAIALKLLNLFWSNFL